MYSQPQPTQIPSSSNPPTQLSTVILWIGITFSICFNISPIFLFYKIIRKIEKYSIIPESMLIFNVLSSLLWYSYCVHRGVYIETVLSYVNVLLSLSFASIYLYYCLERHCWKWWIATIILIDVYMQMYLLYVYYISPYSNIRLIAMVINVFTFASPGQNVYKVINEKNYKFIPVECLLFGEMCAVTWLAFGIVRGDVYSMLINTIGVWICWVCWIIWGMSYFRRGKQEEKGEEWKNVQDDEYGMVDN